MNTSKNEYCKTESGVKYQIKAITVEHPVGNYTIQFKVPLATLKRNKHCQWEYAVLRAGGDEVFQSGFTQETSEGEARYLVHEALLDEITKY